MSHSFEINFEPLAIRESPERITNLDIVITPIDAFTGQIVPGIQAKISTQLKRAQRSLSGHLIFEKLLPADTHTIEFDVTGTGYFQPPNRVIDMPQVKVKPTDIFENEADKQAKLLSDTRLLHLIKRPESVDDGDAMVVRGRVRKAGEWAEGVEIIGVVDDEPEQFRSLTNERGVFAIQLRPPNPVLDADAVEVPVQGRVVLLFDGGNEWNSDGVAPGLNTLEDLKTHVIRDAIDIN